MSEHSKEPWAYQRELSGGTVTEERGLKVASTAWADDSRRIVACVNALAGVSTETIEGYEWRDGLPNQTGDYWMRHKDDGNVHYVSVSTELLAIWHGPSDYQHAPVLIGPPPAKEGE